MNIFPTDKPIHTNLSTTFTSFDALMDDVSAARVNGYVRISFPGYEGALFLTGGIPVGAMEVSGGSRRMGPTVVEAVSQRVRERGGTLDVYALDPELVPILASMSESHPMHQELTTEWVDARKLLDWLKACGQPGHVDLRMVEADGQALAIFGAGRIVAAMATVGGRQLVGDAALEFITREAQASPALINVFRAAPALADPTTEFEAPGGRGAASLRPLGLAPRREPDRPGAIAASTPSPERAEPAPLPVASATAHEVLQSWSTILGAIQDTCAEMSRNVHFDLALREALLEVSATFDYLDPFSADFEYVGGQARFAGPLPDTFAKAMNMVVESLISRLATQLRRDDFEAIVKSRIAGLGRVANAAERGRIIALEARAS